jgi:hypothetical protein
VQWLPRRPGPPSHALGSISEPVDERDPGIGTGDDNPRQPRRPQVAGPSYTWAVLLALGLIGQDVTPNKTCYSHAVRRRADFAMTSRTSGEYGFATASRRISPAATAVRVTHRGQVMTYTGR